MIPTIQENDRVYVDFDFYSKEKISRYDLVLIRNKVNKNHFRVLRTIGLPKETVRINESEITIDNYDLNLPVPFPQNIDLGSSELELGPNQFFLLGDNYLHSYDSRHSGAYDKSEILGKVVRIERE